MIVLIKIDKYRKDVSISQGDTLTLCVYQDSISLNTNDTVIFTISTDIHTTEYIIRKNCIIIDEFNIVVNATKEEMSVLEEDKTYYYDFVLLRNGTRYTLNFPYKFYVIGRVNNE